MQSLPSPASSPSLTPQDSTSSTTGRKRQRSHSMQSDNSSSSVKRAASEGLSHDGSIQSPRADQISALSLSESNNDIDTYMAEQGEADIPDSISLGPPLPQNGSISQATSSSEKFTTVEKLRKEPMKVGDTWYVVSRAWYRRWMKACTGEVDKEGALEEKDLGPVDNSPLVDRNGNLTSSAVEGVTVEFVPREVWSSFVSWYGEPLHPLPRMVIAIGIAREPSLELHPRRLKPMKLTNNPNSTEVSGLLYPPVSVSSMDSVETLCKQLATAVSASTDTPYRVWKVDGGGLLLGSEYPSGKLAQDGARVLQQSDQTVEEALIESDDAFVVEFQENGGWIISDTEVTQQTPSQPEVPPPLFSSENDFFSRMQMSSSSSSGGGSSKIATSSTYLKPAAKINSITTINSRPKSMQVPGTLGLGNMGNTCFMNSALQCLAHTPELCDYFLSGVFQEELNPDNPLGMHGAIAEAFGALLERIWSTDSNSTSYSPREFKSQLQRFAPQFSGYQQHDSQELVAFLLDGLHEDLNRVLKKPYVEKPDWEGGGAKELVELARKSWEGYMLRNDSVIVDLFQGQYQSTLVCPECQKVSITFDPFMYLTLPLPVQKKWRHTVFYVPWDLDKPHVKIPVEIGRDASFKDLRNLLGRWMGAPSDNLLTLEVFSHRFYKNLDDNLLCGEMADNDIIVCFELPCHAQQSRTYKKNDNDPFILPLLLFESPPSRNSYSRTPSLFGYPSVVVISQEQATSEEMVYNAVVERLQRWTANARDLFTWEAGSVNDMEEVPIHITSPTPADSITEIQENGDIVTVQEYVPEEGDIADEKGLLVEVDDISMDTTSDDTHEPKKTRTKQDIFTLRLQGDNKPYGAGLGYGPNAQRFESWKDRQDDTEQATLLRSTDVLFCEFDENMKAYYFGDERSQWEHARWDTWEEFIHPEYDQAQKASAERKNKGISLQDCLDEFTKEEQLGEDDLWYCPRCKKHQQATKKFDLWKAPDVLVVHLKRFSNSRALRDKIDTFVDFPIDGLNLEDMVGERKVAKDLLAAGIDAEELHLGNLDEPLVYDLFGVDEHIGGLGGGHYRAYALNHTTDKWYHFDDSYVTQTRPTDAVNANAYLLFYRRRANRALGGKSHDKVEESRLRSKSGSSIDGCPIVDDTQQLPTPPNETNSSYLDTGLSRLTVLSKNRPPATASSLLGESWPTPKSSPASSPPPLDEADPPSFEEAQYDQRLDALALATRQFDFPDPPSKGSPTSSNEADFDGSDNGSDNGDTWPVHFDLSHDRRMGVQETALDAMYSPDWSSLHRLASPTGSSSSDMNPFSDVNAENKKHDAGKFRELLPDSSTLDLDIDV